MFSDRWTRSMGWAPEEGDKPGPAVYIGPLVTSLVAATALAVLARAAGADSVGDGVVLGGVTGLGIAAAVLFVIGYFDPKKPKPMTWFAITGGYHLAGLLIASVVVSMWT